MSAYKDACRELSERYRIDDDTAREFICRDVVHDCVKDEALDHITGFDELPTEAMWQLVLESFERDADHRAKYAIGAIVVNALSTKVRKLLAYRAQEDQDNPDPWREIEKEATCES